MDREVRIPVILLVIGFVIQILAIHSGTDSPGIGIVLLAVLILIVLRLALAIPACYLAAKILDTGFGYLSTAILKLAAIIVLSGAVGMLIRIPLYNWIVFMVTCSVLSMWLFELEFYQGSLLALIILGMNVLAWFLYMGIYTSIVG